MNLGSFLEKKDEKGEVVGSWAEERNPNSGIAWCKYCSTEVNFQQGSRSLLVHSMRNKHKENKALSAEDASKQLNLEETIEGKAKESEEESKADEDTYRFEIDLARSLSCHKVSNLPGLPPGHS